MSALEPLSWASKGLAEVERPVKWQHERARDPTKGCLPGLYDQIKPNALSPISISHTIHASMPSQLTVWNSVHFASEEAHRKCETGHPLGRFLYEQLLILAAETV